MSKLYISEYREINVNYLLKIIVTSKILILVVTLFMTAFSAYWAYSIAPIYESKALLKIGQFSTLQRDGEITHRFIESTDALAKELSYLFIGRSDNDASIIKITPDRRVNYIEILSEGLSPENSASVITNLLIFVQNEHLKAISNNRKQLQVALRTIIDKVNAVTEKQQKFLSDDVVYDNKDYSSLVNTLQLMSIIETDLGVGYIGQLLERKEQIELMLGDGFEENSKLVGEILTSVQPIRPHKSIIIIFGFFTGLFLSVAIIFYREVSLKRSDT